MYDQSKITLGKTIKNARQHYGFSQQDLCKLLVAPSNCSMTIDRCLLAKIENNRIDIRSSEYDWLISRIGGIFALDIVWLEQIRQQTEVEPLDLSQAVAVFPIYFNRKTVYLHRLVAEQTVDRKLRPGEVVHHLDEDKSNNSPENLVVCSSASVHCLYHLQSGRQKMEAARLVRQGDLWF